MFPRHTIAGNNKDLANSNTHATQSRTKQPTIIFRTIGEAGLHRVHNEVLSPSRKGK